MTRTRPVLLALPLVLGCLGCLPGGGDSSNVLEGSCDNGQTHCVDIETIQECEEGQWSAPAECPPEISTGGGIPVELVTWCTDTGCRPGG